MQLRKAIATCHVVLTVLLLIGIVTYFTFGRIARVIVASNVNSQNIDVEHFVADIKSGKFRSGDELSADIMSLQPNGIGGYRDDRGQTFSAEAYRTNENILIVYLMNDRVHSVCRFKSTLDGMEEWPMLDEELLAAHFHLVARAMSLQHPRQSPLNLPPAVDTNDPP
jgi:hypothetical protein